MKVYMGFPTKNVIILVVTVTGWGVDLSYMCHGQGCRVFLGMGDLPPLMTGIFLMGI